MYHEGVKFFHKNNSQRISIIYLSLRKASCLNFPMVSHVQIHTIHLCRYGWFPHKRRQPTITQLVSNYKAIQTKITETKNLNTTIRDTKSFKNQLYNSLKKSEKKKRTLHSRNIFLYRRQCLKASTSHLVPTASKRKFLLIHNIYQWRQDKTMRNLTRLDQMKARYDRNSSKWRKLFSF